jgi:hypothetical protein
LRRDRSVTGLSEVLGVDRTFDVRAMASEQRDLDVVVFGAT